MRTRIAWIVGAAALVGCGPPTAEKFGEDYEAALCEWAAGCRIFEDEKQCDEALVWEAQGRFDYMVEAIAAGRARFDADAAERCFQAIEALACEETTLNEVLFSTGFAAAPAACGEVYVGAVGNYEPCLHSGECAGDAVCGYPPCDEMCCEGSCRQKVEGPKVGEPCTGSCAPGAFCATDPVTFQPTVCTKLLGVGKACSTFGAECKEGLYCRYNGVDAEAQCAEQIKAGEPCDGSGSCADGLSCYSVGEGDSRCQEVPNIGDVCQPNNYPACAQFASFCDGETRTCEPFAEIGEPCEDRQCVPHATCDGSLCIANAGLGEACGSSGEVYLSCLGHLSCGPENRCVAPDAPATCSVPKK